jgi:LPXTG-site transpeptidase (sortase) family protein
MHRSDVGGAALLNTAKAREGLVPTSSAPSSTKTPPAPACVPQLTTSGSPKVELPAILEVPAIGMQAPVQDGLTDAVLDDSVGHDPTTVWPGGWGISILEAHDVSYFSGLGAVKIGQEVSWIDDCQEATFRVDKIEVVTPGTALPAPPNGKGIALITCSPADALFWTPDRLVVLATYVGAQPTGTKATTTPPALGLTLPLPKGLAGADLSLSGNNLLVGTLSINGSPSRAWSESADPLRAAQLAFRGLAAATRAVDVSSQSWWSSLALPGVSMPSSIPIEDEFNAAITVAGNRITAISLQSPLGTVDFVVHGAKLYLSSVSSPT